MVRMGLKWVRKIKPGVASHIKNNDFICPANEPSVRTAAVQIKRLVSIWSTTLKLVNLVFLLITSNIYLPVGTASDSSISTSQIDRYQKHNYSWNWWFYEKYSTNYLGETQNWYDGWYNVASISKRKIKLGFIVLNIVADLALITIDN